ncbi:MAG: nucleoside phosphorylase [Chloroflexota bacterium]
MTDNTPILTPQELLAYRRATGALPQFNPPRAVIFAPQKSLAAYVLRRHPTRKISGFAGEFYLFKRTNGQVALSTAFGIGAPVVAGLTDEFAALGVKEFALIGMAGGLQPDLQTGSLVLSTGAIRGEGTSRHYLPLAGTVETSPEMTRAVSRILSGKNCPHALGPTWTTDAPFREFRKDVLAHQTNGVLAVDMEAAAMLAVAKANHLPALAAFSIADTLANGTWHMSRDLRKSQQGLTALFDSVLHHLTQTT